jgi:hypothetical protein
VDWSFAQKLMSKVDCMFGILAGVSSVSALLVATPSFQINHGCLSINHWIPR